MTKKERLEKELELFKNQKQVIEASFSLSLDVINKKIDNIQSQIDLIKGE